MVLKKFVNNLITIFKNFEYRYSFCEKPLIRYAYFVYNYPDKAAYLTTYVDILIYTQ